MNEPSMLVTDLQSFHTFQHHHQHMLHLLYPGNSICLVHSNRHIPHLDWVIEWSTYGIQVKSVINMASWQQYLDHIYSALSANFTSTADIVFSFSFSVSTTTVNRWHWRATFSLVVKQIPIIQQISGAAVHKSDSPFVMLSIGWFGRV